MVLNVSSHSSAVLSAIDAKVRWNAAFDGNVDPAEIRNGPFHQTVAMIFALDISSDDHGFASSVFYQATGFFRVVILAPTTIKFTKLETSVIGKGMIARLLNIDETLAKTAAAKLRVVTMPEPADGAAPPRDDLDPFPALRIIKRGPKRFEVRKLVIFVTDGVDAKLLQIWTDRSPGEGHAVKYLATRNIRARNELRPH